MVKMTPERLDNHNYTFWYKAELVNGVYCEPIEITSGNLGHIAYDLSTDGVARIETTLSPIKDINAETAVWRELAIHTSISPAVTAVRAKSTGANGVFLIRAQ